MWTGLLVFALWQTPAAAEAEASETKPPAASAQGADSAERPPSKATAKPSPPQSLRGGVTGPDGRPVHDALVWFRPSSSGYGAKATRTRTDKNGQFLEQLATLAPLDVQVEAKGLAAWSKKRVRPDSPLRVRLEKGGFIEGIIREGDAGGPLQGVVVEARSRSNMKSSWAINTSRPRTQTDAEGHFRLEGLARGFHMLVARARGYGSASEPAVPLGRHVELYLFPGPSLSGEVVDRQGRPVPGASVQLLKKEGRPQTEKTDARGRFEAFGLEPGRYVLLAHLEGWAPGWVTGLDVGGSGEHYARVTLEAGARVIGRLVDDADKPVAGRVVVAEADGWPLPRALQALLQAQTENDGRFELEGVPPLGLTLVARAPAAGMARVDVVVPEGEPLDLGDVRLEAGHSLRGVVRERSGAPISGALVAAPPDTQVRTNGDGTFVLKGLRPKRLYVRVTADGYAPSYRMTGPGPDPLEFILDAAGAVVGTVQHADGRPVESFRVRLRPAERRKIRIAPQRDDVADPGGAFRVNDLPAATYVLTVSAPGLRPAHVSDVQVSAGGETDVGVLRLDAGGSLRGIVVNASGTPVAGARIAVSKQGSSFFGQEPGALSDTGGQFELRGLAPGSTSLIATHPRFADQRVQGVTVDPAAATTEVRIVMAVGGTLQGAVRGRDGAGIPGLTIRVLPMAGQRPSFGGSKFEVVTGDDGAFSIERVPAGQVYAMLMLPTGNGAFRSGKTRVAEVRESEVTPLDFQYRKVLVTGRVTRSGLPAPGLRVKFRGQSPMAMVTGGSLTSASRTGPQHLVGLTAEDGTYELLVDDPGGFSASVEDISGQTRLASRKVEIPDVDRHVLDLTVGGIAVTGTVVDAETEQPIPTGWVTASGLDPKRDTVSADVQQGTFRLELEPGEYRVQARVMGYTEEAAEISVDNSGAPEVHLRVSRGLELTGHVVDAAGRPAEGAFVRAASVAAPPPSAFTESLPDGSFRLTGLEPRPYSLTATQRGSSSFAVWPAATPGDEGVLLRLEPGGHLRVTVRDADGRPVEGVYVRVSSVDGVPVSASGVSAANGVAEFAAPAGRLELRASQNPLRATATVDLARGGQAEATLILRPPEAEEP